MLIDFCKMHSLGNDFVVINAITQRLSIYPELAAHIASRKTGVGCDQVLVITPPISADVDFNYRIFNQDGSEAIQCGNGARCVARFAYESGLVVNKEITAECKSGKVKCIIKNFNNISTNLGKATFEGEKTIQLNEKSYDFFLVNTGNTHAVLFTDTQDLMELSNIASGIQKNHNVNVNFVAINSKSSINLITFEAGVGHTLACGSGSCASVAVGIRHKNLANNVKVHLKLGYVQVNLSKEQNLWLSGPTRSAFYGKFRV